MRIPVLGMDPSLRNWGLASAVLDLSDGVLDTPVLTLIETQDPAGKQVRQNSKDLHLAEQLAVGALAQARRAKAIFVEVPVGSQSARAMASYGVCVGVLGAIRAEGIPLIEVTASEVKLSLTRNKNATKQDMIDAAIAWYPDANWLRYKRNGQVHLSDKNEHLADAVAAIHAGVHTPVFQNLMRLLKDTTRP